MDPGIKSWMPGHLFDLGLCRAGLPGTWQLLLRQLLLDLRLDFLELGQLRFANVVEPYDVVAELRLDRRRRWSGPSSARSWPARTRARSSLALAQSRSPPLAPEPGSLDCFLAISSNLAPFLSSAMMLLGFVFLFHQDVARLVFLAAVGGDELVVLGLDVGVGHRVGLPVVGEQLADQHAWRASSIWAL